MRAYRNLWELYGDLSVVGVRRPEIKTTDLVIFLGVVLPNRLL